MTTFTDETARFEGDDGELLQGIAIYDLRYDYDAGEWIAELASMRIGQLVLSRYQVADAVGEATVSKHEEYVRDTECVSDPMGDAADAAYGFWVAE